MLKPHRLAAAMALVLLPGVAFAQQAPFNGTLGAGPQVVIPAGPWRFFRYFNVSPASGPTMWCTRLTGATPAPNAPGSFPIAPGNGESFANPGYVPATPTICAGQGAVVTAEAY